MPGTMTVRADEVVVGDVGVEADGAELPIIEVTPDRGCIRIVCRSTGLIRGTPACRVRPSTRIRIVQRAS